MGRLKKVEMSNNVHHLCGIIPGPDKIVDLGVQDPMRHDDTFGRAGGAARVDQHRVLVDNVFDVDADGVGCDGKGGRGHVELCNDCRDGRAVDRLWRHAQVLRVDQAWMLSGKSSCRLSPRAIRRTFPLFSQGWWRQAF